MSADSFNDALEQFFRAMRQARVKPPATGNLTVPQMLLLLPLLDGDRPCGVRELADAAAIASPTASRTLDGLERDGLMIRRPSEADRRCVLVELTDEGRAQAEAAREAARARACELYAAPGGGRARGGRAHPAPLHRDHPVHLSALRHRRRQPRSTARRILPLLVLGSSAAKSTMRGYL